MSDPTPNAIRPETAAQDNQALQALKNLASIEPDQNSPTSCEVHRRANEALKRIEAVAPSPPPSAGSAEERLRRTLKGVEVDVEMVRNELNYKQEDSYGTLRNHLSDVLSRVRAALAGK